MRLSDVKGERTFEVIADIIEPIATIAEDERVAELFSGQRPKEGQTAGQAFMQRLRTVVPVLCKEHRDEVVAVLAAIGGTTPKEYLDGCSMATLAKDVFELMTDEDFLGFLSSDETEGGSGTSQESTEE